MVSPLPAAAVIVTVPTVRLRVPKSKVPPPMFTAPFTGPSVPAPDSARVPPLMLVPLLWVFAAVTVRVPAPIFVSEPPVLVRGVARITFWPFVSSL